MDAKIEDQLKKVGLKRQVSDSLSKVLKKKKKDKEGDEETTPGDSSSMDGVMNEMAENQAIQFSELEAGFDKVNAQNAAAAQKKKEEDDAAAKKKAEEDAKVLAHAQAGGDNSFDDQMKNLAANPTPEGDENDAGAPQAKVDNDAAPAAGMSDNTKVLNQVVDGTQGTTGQTTAKASSDSQDSNVDGTTGQTTADNDQQNNQLPDQPQVAKATDVGDSNGSKDSADSVTSEGDGEGSDNNDGGDNLKVANEFPTGGTEGQNDFQNEGQNDSNDIGDTIVAGDNDADSLDGVMETIGGNQRR